jgi:hypothetical protein
MSMRFTKLNYCQYLLSSQINYTLTNLAEHLEAISYDQINRYLRREKLTPHLLWENVQHLIQVQPKEKKVKLFRGKSLYRQNGICRY